MAKVESLGIHTPVALPYLIRDGILPAEPKKDSYYWQTYVFHDAQGEVEEEILATTHCVIWSQGKFIRNVYRFELEGEDVAQALLTTFPNVANTQRHGSHEASGAVNGYNKLQGRSRHSLGKPLDKPSGLGLDDPSTEGQSSRALVVFLKTKAHIYFLQGASHIVDLPFEIERALPAPRGCIIQRKPKQRPAAPPTPHIPAAPPNSFLSAPPHPSSSWQQSPTLARSFRVSQPARPSPLGGGNGRLDALFQDVLGSAGAGADEDFASLYSFANPLSDLGILTYAVQHQKPRFSRKTQPGLTVAFETLGAEEEIVYVSPKNELDDGHHESSGSLMLIVTANSDLRSLTIWHAWYIEEKSLRDLIKQRAAQKAAKARRRSSFLSANLGTGGTSLTVKGREHARESLAAGSMRLPGDTAAASRSVSRKPTRQEEEEAMASQMDPDYHTSQQPARESRRISSLNVDLRASQTAVNTSFAGLGSRRNASFGGPGDRKSFGHRKSRGSTPGSVFGRSLGPDDDTMDLDNEFDSDESIEHVVRHIRATFDAAGADSVFGSEAGSKRELVVRKMHSIPIASRYPSVAQSFRAVVVKESHPSSESEDHRLGLYIHDRNSKDLIGLKLVVKLRALRPDQARSLQVAVPLVTAESNMGKCSDITKLRDDNIAAVLVGERGLMLSSDAGEICSLPPQAPYRVYNALDPVAQNTGDKDIGRNRTLQMLDRLAELTHTGATGSYDEVDGDGVHHRRRLRLRPEDSYIDRLLEVCQLVLPARQAGKVRHIWCTAHAWLVQHQESLAGTAVNAERVALAATVFVFVEKLLDSKARAALNISRVATGKGTATESGSLKLHRQGDEAQLLTRSAWSWMEPRGLEQSQRTPVSPNTRSRLDTQKDRFLPIAAALAVELAATSSPQSSRDDTIDSAMSCAVRLMLGLHIFREDESLCVLSSPASQDGSVTSIIAQLGSWLELDAWGFKAGSYYSFEGASEAQWVYVRSMPLMMPQVALMPEPVGVYQWFEHALQQQPTERYPSLAAVAGLRMSGPVSSALHAKAKVLTPRLCALSDVLEETAGLTTSPAATVELMARYKIHSDMLEVLPEAIAAPFREAIVRCEREPPTTWPVTLLRLVGREDLQMEKDNHSRIRQALQPSITVTPRDVQTMCHALDHAGHPTKTREASRHSVSQLIFCEDRRLVEAVMLMHYQQPHPQVGECPKQPDWSDAHHFEHQRRLMQFVALRMLSLPAGDGMIHYHCESPLLTEKYPVSGFSSVCLMQPMGHILTIDRTGMNEEKFGWAYFHAGVSAGLRISQNVKGIDTSWIAFNKPSELTNRHAGLLLALGLGGHLRTLAKWLSFKYLTPKHTMTSVGLLLGLSASYLGTMDSLITRMLSVHITRMLPPGAAELNVSPITQTAGLMGIGLLYYNTQHRRMSEIMLSEIEYMEAEDPDSGPDPLRDESYRLAAGFALGLINVGKGRNLRGMHGMYLPERLLAIAVGPRPVHAVHVFDRATAGAIVAIALVYMKSGDQAIARKIDIPDTEAQFDHVRPDMLMLRAMARHIITWDNIVANPSRSGKILPGWIQANLPTCYKNKLQAIENFNGKFPFRTSDLPFYNIATGLAWAMGLKHAGSGNQNARDEILSLLHFFYMVSGETFYHDAKLARMTVRRCIDVLALSAATVMAGTGDLVTFRYLRRLHGRTDAETPYGSHLAAHMAIGVLFLGGGTYTFGTSDFATAALICAFYPLFPTDVHDNRVHLQAFRHFWVFAAEPRCLVVEDIDTHRPIKLPIIVTTKDGKPRAYHAPCLLPGLDTIASVQTADPAYWRVTLDFAVNPAHLAAFRRNQTIYVRSCPAAEAHSTVFGTTLAALNDAPSSRAAAEIWHAIFDLPALRTLDKADIELILPPDGYSSVRMEGRGTVVDDRLMLRGDATVGGGGGVQRRRAAWWGLRVLLAWAERAKEDGDGRVRWLGNEVVEVLRARVEEKVNGARLAD